MLTHCEPAWTASVHLLDPNHVLACLTGVAVPNISKVGSSSPGGPFFLDSQNSGSAWEQKKALRAHLGWRQGLLLCTGQISQMGLLQLPGPWAPA